MSPAQWFKQQHSQFADAWTMDFVFSGEDVMAGYCSEKLIHQEIDRLSQPS